MRLLKLALILAPVVVLADSGLWQGGEKLGPVRDIACVADGGLFCSRDSGYPHVGMVQCLGATATEPGCMTPSAQSLAGNKTWSGWHRVIGVAHASLTACSAGQKNTLQGCTTHGAPVWCNGTTNIELTGSSSLVTLASLQVNRMVHGANGYLGAFTLPYDFTVTTLSGIIQQGAGTTINLRVTDGVGGNCDCSVDCTTGNVSACTGGCSFAAGTQVVATPNSDNCTTPITVFGAITVTGYKL